ncbi:hypothetical protein BDV12DRAFT_210350 [Aspergillus spectabilis]
MWYLTRMLQLSFSLNVLKLRRKLNRHVPGYLDENTGSIRESEKLNREALGVRDDNVDVGENKVPVSLLDTLMERQFKASVGLLEVTSSKAKEAFNESSTALFSCGASLPIIIDNDTTGETKGHDSVAHKLILPADASAPETNLETLQRLVTDCEPASFGRGEKDVLDPDYRRAGKINVKQFATSFHLVDFGVLENVGQVLLPSISIETDNQLGFRKIMAELYKLNMSHFRKHIDTPRAANQIGSLVVYLPSPSKVRAAFYSDCEHEIETITEGGRITLTNNCMNLLLSRLPHSSKLAKSQLPGGLKGADLVLYSVFKSLGLDIEVPPVLEKNGKGFTESPELGLTGRIPEEKRRRYYVSQWYSNHTLQAYLEKALPKYVLGSEYEDVDRRWKLLLTSRRVLGMDETVESAKAGNLPLKENSIYTTGGAQVSSSCHVYEIHDSGAEQDLDHVVRDVWLACYLRWITWFTKPKHKEMALARAAYGNELSIGIQYSCAAVLAVIPPGEKRVGILR